MRTRFGRTSAFLGLAATTATIALLLIVSTSMASDGATRDGAPPGLHQLRSELQQQADAHSWSPVNENGAREGQVGACLPDGRSCATVFWTGPEEFED